MLNVNPYRSDGFLDVGGATLMDIVFGDDRGVIVAEFTPCPQFWQLWREDKDAMRDAGFRPYKDPYGQWQCRWREN